MKFAPRWVTYGKPLSTGKPYTVSVPSTGAWGSTDPAGKKLTDGVVGPPYAGGIGPTFGLCWDQGSEPKVVVDLGEVEPCGAFRIQAGGGYPWWDSLKGEVNDRIEVLTSLDGKEFTSQGLHDLNLRWRDLPVNHMWPDEEAITAHLFELVPREPVPARYVQWKISPRRTLCVSEVQVLDSIKYEPFDLRIALPEGESPPVR
jgi:hypothetical protein